MTRALHVFGLALLLALAACGQDEDASRWAASVAESTHAAEISQAAGDLRGARIHLEEILNLDVPAGVAAADARVVRQDAATRLSALALKAGEATDALGWADRALNEGEADDVFAAGAHLARGHALEALERAPEATADYHRALTIDEALLQQALHPSDAPGEESR